MWNKNRHSCFAQTITLWFLLLLLVFGSQKSIAQDSEEFSQKADSLKLLLPAKVDTNYANSLCQIAKMHLYSGQDDSATKYISEAYRISSKLNYSHGKARALLLNGKFEITNFKPLDRATGFLLKSLEIFTSLKDYKGIAECNLQLGVLSFDMQNFEEAITYFKNVLDFDPNNSRLKATTHYLLAICYSEIGEFEKANKMFELASKEIGADDAHFQLQLETFRGKLYVNKKEYARAINHFNDVITRFEPLFEQQNIAPTYAFLATAYYNNNNNALAIKFGRMAYNLCYGRGAYGIYLRESETTLHKAYRAIGNQDSAYFFLNDLSSINDSMYNNRVLQRVAVMKGVHEFEQLLEVKRAEQELKDVLTKQTFEREKALRNFLLIGFFIVVIFAAVFLSQRNKISIEKKRSDELLRNILPYETAEELKATGSSEARQFDLVSVLFTDFVGFTQISEKLSPTQLVQEINVFFSAFDAILDTYGIEKIKTIGDAYMAAGGLPVPKNDSVKNTVLAALTIRDFIVKSIETAEKEGKLSFEMRVGVHTGPVVAGIVGIKKFQYDIWGDTVNTANRMEVHGEAKKVNISGYTYNLIKNQPEFSFTHRGKIQVKGKGEVDMYFVEWA